MRMILEKKAEYAHNLMQLACMQLYLCTYSASPKIDFLIRTARELKALIYRRIQYKSRYFL